MYVKCKTNIGNQEYDDVRRATPEEERDINTYLDYEEYRIKLFKNVKPMTQVLTEARDDIKELDKTNKKITNRKKLVKKLNQIDGIDYNGGIFPSYSDKFQEIKENAELNT